MEIAKFYLDHPLQRYIKNLDGSMSLLLVRLTQGWSDGEIMAALSSGEILYFVEYNKYTLTKRRQQRQKKIGQPWLCNRRRVKRRLRAVEYWG